MKRILLLFIFLGVCQMARAQVVTVKDAESEEPLEFVTIYSNSPREYATTDASGQANISVFRGANKIEFRSIGYETATRSYAELEAESFALRLEPVSVKMDAIVVSASRWEQNSADLSYSVASIDKESIALQNPQTAADLLAISGKVYIQKSQQGGGSPMIRGFATNRLLYAIDGVRMNTAIFRSGNIQNVISLDPFAMENAEVLFGPASVIYGSDAIGGVMSFQTLTPQFSYESEPYVFGKAVARYSGANQEKTGHFDVGIGWEKWALVSSISTNNYGDLRMGQNGPDDYLKPYYVERIDSADVVVENDDPLQQRPSGFSQINMMQKLRFRPDENWDFQYAFHYSETSDYGRYDRHQRLRDGLPRYAEWKYGPQTWMMNQFSLSHTSTNSFYDILSLRLAQQSFGESRISRDLNDPNREIRAEDVLALSANLDFVKAIGANRLYYGLEAVQNEVTSTGTNENIETGKSEEGPSRYPNATWASYGAYVSADLRLAEKWKMQAGMRYNQVRLNAKFDTRFYPLPFTTAALNNGALTGSMGFVFRPDAQWIFSINGSTAFRAPNVDDVGKVFDSEPGAVVVPNPDLKAEYAYNADIGIARVFGKAVKLDLTAYYTHLNNALVRRNFVLNGQDSIIYDGELSQVQAIQNAAVARVYGVQAGLEVKLPAGFEFRADYNFQRGEEELDDGSLSPSRHAAPWFGVASIGYTHNDLQLRFYAEANGERSFEDMPFGEIGKTEIYAADADGNPYAPGWYTLNFKARYRVSEQFSVSAALENITDQRYRPYSSGISAPGRNFILAIRADF
ncbi:MAG: TonB-dependent receptor [Bacteroidetes bacterium]|nr:TonB-dependent receptor [Bacteroidota bacterium]